MKVERLFRSFIIGGFECSTHCLRNGTRLDLIAISGHDQYATNDYLALRKHRIYTVREGIRWHLIERTPGQYDFSSLLPVIHAARETKTQVIWDLCHFGWPDDIDIFKPEFIKRFAKLARAFATVAANETDEIPFYGPINEISYLAWAGGQKGSLNPFALGRGVELKAQLARASIEAIEAIWEVDPRARIVNVDPLIHVIPETSRQEDRPAAERKRQTQYEGWDILAGRRSPEIGGAEKYVDIIGVNYYPYNQFFLNSYLPIGRDHPEYRPFREILKEVYERYKRPLIIAETSAEDGARPLWLRYIGEEVRKAMQADVPVEGLCYYPILSRRWDDGRRCPNGLLGDPDAAGNREVYAPLANEIDNQLSNFFPA